MSARLPSIFIRASPQTTPAELLASVSNGDMLKFKLAGVHHPMYITRSATAPQGQDGMSAEAMFRQEGRRMLTRFNGKVGIATGEVPPVRSGRASPDRDP